MEVSLCAVSPIMPLLRNLCSRSPLPPLLPSPVRPRSRWLTLGVKTYKAEKNDNQLKLCENIWQLQIEFIPFELNFLIDEESSGESVSLICPFLGLVP